MRLITILLCCLLVQSRFSLDSHAQGPGFRGGRGGDPLLVADRDDFHYLLNNHKLLERKVEPIENGVRTLTESDDPEVVKTLQRHVATMAERVKHHRPVRMWDPLFQEIFRHGDQVKLEFENTPRGVRVTETSDDPQVVSLIQEHARVVSGFVEHGFEEARQAHPVPKDGGQLVAVGQVDPADKLATFAAFDRVYIPALALTNQVKLPQATAALKRLRQAWNEQLEPAFLTAFPGDKQWPAKVGQVSGAMTSAAAHLQTGECLAAHEALEPVRDLLAKTRRRNGVDYPLDQLAAFHTTMEAIVKPAKEMTPAEVTPEYLAALKEQTAAAATQWEQVEQTDFQLEPFGKPASDQTLLDRMIQAERAALEALAKSLNDAPPEAVLKSAVAIKRPFAQAYMFFGDFAKRP